MDDDTAAQRHTALRLALGSLGTLAILLVLLVLIRPDMAMHVLHHMEAMIGIDAAANH